MHLIKYPSPILRTKTHLVTNFDSELAKTVESMISIMLEYNGIGLAAPQVGISQRIIVVKPANKEPQALVNIELIRQGIRTKSMVEGCLSLPGIYGEVIRPHKIEFIAQDINGNKKQYYYEGLTSRIIQHEMDHLEGVLIIDRFSQKDLDKIKPVLEKLT